MTTIAAAIERLETVLERREGFGIGTNTAVTTLTGGLACATDEGHWHHETDLAAAMGGTGGAPSPGVLLRAAFGSCMAMSYRLRAARHGVEVTSIRVTVETDSELAGMLLVDADPPPGYTAIRYHVEVESPSPEADVLAVLDEGDQLSPVLDALVRTNAVSRTTSVNRTTPLTTPLTTVEG